jgi:flagellar biosynthesis protein
MDKSQSSPETLKPPKVAIALSHDGHSGGLPKIVASGRGILAEQILELAFQNNIKVREDADLVEILAALDIDSDIPSGAVIAVAEILARVYAANQDHEKIPPLPTMKDTPS